MECIECSASCTDGCVGSCETVCSGSSTGTTYTRPGSVYIQLLQQRHYAYIAQKRKDERK